MTENESKLTFGNSSEVTVPILHIAQPQDTIFTFQSDERYVTLNFTKGTVESNIGPDDQCEVIVRAMNQYINNVTCLRCGSVITDTTHD